MAVRVGGAGDEITAVGGRTDRVTAIILRAAVTSLPFDSTVGVGFDQVGVVVAAGNSGTDKDQAAVKRDLDAVADIGLNSAVGCAPERVAA